MNTSLQLTTRNIPTSRPAARPSLFTRLVQAIARQFNARHDEPAALRYIANKYPGKMD